MRVLHVYSGNLYGGVETLLVALARCRDLCPTMEPHYALCFEGRLSEELLATGVSCHSLGNVQVSRPWTVWKARRRLAELLRRVRFDVAVCHSAWPQAIFGPTVQSAGLPLIFWQHDATNGRHWLERWASTTVPDLVICNSKFTAGTLPNLYPNVPAEVLYYPVMVPEANQSHAERTVVRAELNTPEDAVVIVQVSRMEAWKGHGLLLEALGKLRHVPGWICWQVGGAQRQHEVQYLESLRSAASRLGIGERVLFLGQRSDVSRLLSAADIHCQPNTGPEPFGITFVEAFLAGLPVVTTAIGGALELVNDSCGIFVQPHDVDALAESLRQLVQDAPLRRRLGAAGVNHARELCDPSTQMRKLLESMTSVVRKTVFV